MERSIIMERMDHMPCDKRFDINGNSELCHCTGYEVCLDGEWWNEYVDSEGGTHYGR